MAVFFASLFVIAFAVLMIAVYGITDRALRAHYLDEVDENIAAIADGYRQRGIPEAVELMQRYTVGSSANDFFLLQDASGRKVAGNLPARRPVLGEVSFFPAPDTEHASGQEILGRGMMLTSGLYLFVGADTFQLAEIREAIFDAFIVVAGLTLLSVLCAGYFFHRNFLSRIDAIAQTCEAIMAGRFQERVRADGSQGEVARLSNTVNSMLDRISSLMENLREVSSAVAHDLRTPLTRLRQTLERARLNARNEQDFQERMDQAIANTDEILEIFTSLLNLSRIEAGARAASFIPVPLDVLLSDIAAIYAPLAADQGKSLQQELRVAASIAGDRTLLMQLFSNLMENAIHHTPSGTCIRLVLDHAGDDVLVRVADNGQGLTAQERDKAFRRFWRGDASRGKPGHGLGLSIVGAIAALHGAEITLVDAKPGLDVLVRFPHARAGADS